jgi:hypothetical protein
MCGVGLNEKGRISACTGTGEISRLQNLVVKSTQSSCFVVILERLSSRIKTHVRNEQGHSCVYVLLGYDVVPIYYSNTMFHPMGNKSLFLPVQLWTLHLKHT